MGPRPRPAGPGRRTIGRAGRTGGVDLEGHRDGGGKEEIGLRVEGGRGGDRGCSQNVGLVFPALDRQCPWGRARKGRAGGNAGYVVEGGGIGVLVMKSCFPIMVVVGPISMGEKTLQFLVLCRGKENFLFLKPRKSYTNVRWTAKNCPSRPCASIISHIFSIYSRDRRIR